MDAALRAAPHGLAFALRPERHSYGLIQETGEFVANVPSAREAWATDYCGVASGRKVDKFKRTGLTAGPADAVRPPILLECPLNLECRVRHTQALGSHTLFLAEIVAVQASADLLDAKGRFALEKAGLLAYAHGHYYELGRQLGHFGFSVKKRQPRKARG